MASPIQQDSRGTTDCFGASRASDLRSRLEARRSSIPAQAPSDIDLRCANCDKVGHRDNSDVRCDFYGRERYDHPDAAAIGSSAPDMFERSLVSIFRDPYQVRVNIHF